MSWFSTVPFILACLALLFLPGLGVLFALGTRRLHLIAVAPVVTVSMLAVAAIAFPMAGLNWSPGPVAGAIAAFCLVLYAIRWLYNRWNFTGSPIRRARLSIPGSRYATVALAGFLAGAAAIAFQLYRAFDRPDNISQTFDNVFHLNAIRYVLDTSNASSLTLTGMTNGDNAPYFYPAAWHGLASLLVQLTDAPISVAVNVLNLCIAATVWSTGCMLLTRVTLGPNPYAIAAAGVLSAGFGSFPLLLLDFGVLYPNFLAVSLLPAALSCVAIFFGVCRGDTAHGLARWSLAPIAAVGVAIAHPNGLMSLLALSIPVVLLAFVRFTMVRRSAGHSYRLTVVASLGLVVLLAVIVVMWIYVRPPAAAATWLPIQTPGQAIGEIITNSAMKRPPAYVVSILAAAGIVAVVRRKSSAWLVGSFAVASALFVVVSAWPAGQNRDALTGVWYNDSYRLAALLPVAAVPLAAAGADWFAGRIRSWLPGNRLGRQFLRSRQISTSGALPVILPIVILAALVVVEMQPLRAPVASARANYQTTPDSPLVSSDEMALINELDSFVPADATIAVNPWTGGAVAFALADRNTTSKHTLTTYTKAVELLNDKFRDAASDPEVCAAASADNVRYVLDFGTREVHGGNHGFVGLQIPDDQPGFTLLARVGAAKLFEVTACR
jgi:hypothetical protein